MRNPAYDGPDGIFTDYEGMDSHPLLTGKKHAPIPTSDWHNVRYTRMLPNGEMITTTDFEMSVADAVDTGIHTNQGVFDLYKVEWKGAQIGHEWRDATEAYKNLYHQRTHYVY